MSRGGLGKGRAEGGDGRGHCPLTGHRVFAIDKQKYRIDIFFSVKHFGQINADIPS